MEITVRHAEPKDYEALHCIFSGPRAIAGTLQLSLPSEEAWRKRLAEPPEGLYSLVGCVGGEVVGNLGLHTSPRWRMRHVGSIGMAVRDDRQGKGVAHSACGGGAAPGEQLAEPDAHRAARLHEVRRGHGVSFCYRSCTGEFQIAAEQTAHHRRSVVPHDNPDFEGFVQSIALLRCELHEDLEGHVRVGLHSTVSLSRFKSSRHALRPFSNSSSCRAMLRVSSRAASLSPSSSKVRKPRAARSW